VGIVQDLDTFVLVPLYTITGAAKSSAIALALLYNDNLSIEEAVKIARVDENY
jgi:chaperone required for assembly of F1-ATPase